MFAILHPKIKEGKLPTMIRADNDPLFLLLKALLRPIARFAIRHSIQIQRIVQALKEVLVEAASDDIEAHGKNPNVSRLSVVTGLQRKDVLSHLHPQRSKEGRTGLLSRIIGQWQLDPRFASSGGRARVLSAEGEDSEFRSLVESVSTDLKPGTLLFELERIGVVERTPRGVRLVKRTYSPRGDISSSLDLLSADSEDLGRAVEENLLRSDGPRHHHAKTEFDAIRADARAEIESWFVEEGKLLHERARAFLSRFDTDIHPEDKGNVPARLRVALGSFSFVEEVTHAQKR